MHPEKYIIGVDVGGTNIVAAAMPLDGSREIGLRHCPTLQANGDEAVISHITDAVEATIDQLRSETDARREQILGVGLGTPGPLSRSLGTVHTTPHFDWHEFPVRDKVAEALGLKVTLDNDANCFTLGEWWKGAARGASHVIGLTLGTGIGGGIIINGHLYHGASDGAGELGHMTVEPQGRKCHCGNWGCLEAYCSASAVSEQAMELARQKNLNFTPEEISAKAVAKAATDGDADALKILSEAGRYLGIGLANLINIFNPEVIVIGGGLALAGNLLIKGAQEEATTRSFVPMSKVCRIVPAGLPISAAVVGAVGSFKLQTLGSI